MREHLTTVTVTTSSHTCNVTFPDGLNDAIDAFITAMQGVGYHRDSIIGCLIELANESDIASDN